MTGAPPRVVALLPAWQAEAFIADTLQSLAAQTWPNLEILISVDVSKDATVEICRAFAADRPNVRVVAQTERQGWIGNTNALLAMAEGDFLFFALHDDLLAPTFVETLARALEAEPAAAIAYCDFETVHQDGATEMGVYDVLAGVASPVERARRVLRQQGTWWAPFRGMFRAEAARRIGGLKRHAAGEFCADWPWLVHMATLGLSIRAPGVHCRKFYKPGSLSKTWRFSLRQWLGVAGGALREVYASDLPLAGKLRLTLTLAGMCWTWFVRALATSPRLRRFRPAG